MSPRPSSWRVLPNGNVLPLTDTQDLLLDMVPVVEDMLDACDALGAMIAKSAQTRQEARDLIVRSRRQRLELHLIRGNGGRPDGHC